MQVVWISEGKALNSEKEGVQMKPNSVYNLFTILVLYVYQISWKSF